MDRTSSLECLIAILATLALPGAGMASEFTSPAPGSVVITVERFEELLEAARGKPDPEIEPEPAPPVGSSLEDLLVSLEVRGDHARVTAKLLARVLAEKGWVDVPLLVAGTAVQSIAIDGAESALEEREGWYVLHLKGRGAHRVDLVYDVPVERLIGGQRVQAPVPRVATGRLEASIPGSGWEVHVLPSSGVEFSSSESSTAVTAVLARTDRVQLLWGQRGAAGATFSRAVYNLHVVGEGVFVEAAYDMEIDSDEPRDVPLVSATYALRDVQVEGVPGRVVLVGDHHAVTLQGHGPRRVKASWALNVDRAAGQPAVDMDVPMVPISRFVLEVPGKRDITVDPVVPLVVEADDAHTKVEANFPRANHVRFGWTDSRPVPEQNVRMNAEGYYCVTAEEGGLRIAARFRLNVISGKAGKLLFRLPESVVIYEVTGDGISDWRTSVDDVEGRILAVYMDEPRHGEFELVVAYDSLLRKDDPGRTEGLMIPVIEPTPIHRFQGVLLLLAGEELELVPMDPAGLSPIGEEALPQDVRAALPAKVAHGFKYVGEAPPLKVRLQAPKKEAARFDVQLSSLLSLDEGALRGQASADVTVKSGRFKELVFRLDPSVTVLDVVAPALLKWSDAEAEGRRIVTVAFTEEMEGTVRVALSFEKILDPALDRLELAPVEIEAADVQRGHVALESSVPVEVEGFPGESIHPIGLDELPRALSEGTQNPILLAYKYSHLPYELAIGIIQHATAETVDSRVQAARLRTEVERQGNLTMEANWVVVNQSRQFLRVDLPEGAVLRPVVVDGRQVRPARGGDGRLIIPLPRSEDPFEVQLVYTLEAAPFGVTGRVELIAPRPDLFVGALDWELLLPDGYTYHRVKTDLSVAGAEEPIGGQAFALRREQIAPTDDPPRVRVSFLRAGRRHGVQALAVVLGLAIAGLLARAGRHPSPVERGLTLGLAAAALATSLLLGASPWALLVPLLLGGLAAYLVQGSAREIPEGVG